MSKNIDGFYRYHLIALLTLFVLCTVIYSNTLHSPFVLDDIPSISENTNIRLINFDFQGLYDSGFKTPGLRPVAHISFALNYYFGGYDVVGYHLVNIIIHFINGVLVYFLALSIFSHSGPSHAQWMNHSAIGPTFLMSLFAALFFVAHPLQTQSVTYMVQRMTSMSAMFYFLSFIFYIRGRLCQIGWQRLILFLGCFVSWVFALGSKQTAVTLPVTILLYELYFFQDLNTAWLKRNLKYFLMLTLMVCLFAFFYLGVNPIDNILGTGAFRDFTMGERLLTQFRVIVFYISLIFYPHPSRLNLFHRITTSHSLVDPITTLLSLLTILGLLGIAVYLFRRNRLISFGILWFFINLALESSVIWLAMIYEHRLYLPIFGPVLIVTYLIFNFPIKRRLWAVMVSAFIILCLGTAAYLRNKVWQDETTLWSDVLSKNPQSHIAHIGLGLALVKQDKITEGIMHYYGALRIEPLNLEAHINLGAALVIQGKIDEAIKHYNAALRMNPGLDKAHYGLAHALTKLGKTDEAIKHYSEVLRIKPDIPVVHTRLGIAFSGQNRMENAVRHFSEALRLNPKSVEAHNNLGLALTKQGRIAEAIKCFNDALKINPYCFDAHHNLGLALANQGKMNAAIKHFSKALQINPNQANAQVNLGVALINQNKTEEAIKHFFDALKIEPKNAYAHYNIGVALASLGRVEEAVGHLSEAIKINPEYAEAQNLLNHALTLLKQQQGTEHISNMKNE